MSMTTNMQVVLIDFNLLTTELPSWGLNKKAYDLIRRQKTSRLLKLRAIPENLKPLLEKVFTAGNESVTFICSKEKEAFFFDAVIAGSEEDLSTTAERLKQIEGEPAELGLMIERTLAGLSKIRPAELTLGNYRLPLGGKTLIMGILNITPDSFSDGGRFNRIEKALEQAYLMAEEGADIIDIGGESTRPGHTPITIEEELTRVMPVISTLKKDNSFKIPLSIDTYKAAVAEQALSAGVEMLNDIWGLKKDRSLGRVAAKYRVPVCLMHNRHSTVYADLIPDIIQELEKSIDFAHRAGIEDDKIIVDPGIGFGKDLQQNLDVMRHLQLFCGLGYPLLLGTSRKSMIGKTLDLPVDDRLEGTLATIVYGIIAGADIVRVHDVKQVRRAAAMTDAIIRR